MFFEPPNLWMLAVEAAVLSVVFVLAYVVYRDLRPHATPRWLTWLLANQWRSILFVVLTAMVGRAALLPFVGIPAPRVNDEFGHLLTADTFSHFRLTNPTPASWQHFETFHVNIMPTYHSMYPVGQGMVLAFGQILFHQPWIGVYLSTSLMCGAMVWALWAFFPPIWALLGGLITVFRFALFSYWMNSYWGGSVPALGGAMALGSVVRLCEVDRSNSSRIRMSCVFAAGLLLLANSRPYEGLACSLPLFGYLAYKLIVSKADAKRAAAMVLPALLIGLAGLAAMGGYNHATTGHALLMPYTLNHRTYWPLPFFMGEKENPAAKLDDPAFVKFFEVTAKVYDYDQTKSLSGATGVELRRVLGNWFFYVGPALTFPAAIGFLSCLKQARLRIAVFVLVAISLALALCIYNLQHYFAPATVAVFIFVVEGLRYMWDSHKRAERSLAVAIGITAALTAGITGSAALYTKYVVPDGRRIAVGQLQDESKRYVVLVSYELDCHYPGDELVHNGADFNSERILWARSKGSDADLDLCAAYGDRTFVSVVTDDVNLTLKPLRLCK